MIDWVDAMCRTWGLQRRWIENRTETDLRPEAEKKDGPPFSGNASSFTGRIKERVSGIESGCGEVEPLEVLKGDALKVSCAIQLALTARALTERQYEALYVQYVVRGPLKVKMDKLRVGRKCFYERIHRAHRILKRWLRDRDNVTVDAVTSIGVYD